MLFTTYYLFRDGDKFVRQLLNVLPFEKAQSASLINRVNEVVGAGVYGVVSIAMIQGLLSGLAFWILGEPSPILWAVVTAFICMIPIAGSFMVWIPASAMDTQAYHAFVFPDHLLGFLLANTFWRHVDVNVW